MKPYDEATNEYVCPVCGRRMPAEYDYRLRNPERRCGVRQLMRLHACSNAYRHIKACQAKETK